MTSEELNRTIEFIIQTEARIAVRMEDLQKAQRRDRLWAKKLLSRLDSDIQEHSSRIQEHAEHIKWWEDFMREEREWRRSLEQAMQKRDEETQKRHEEFMAGLDRILGKPSDRIN